MAFVHALTVRTPVPLVPEVSVRMAGGVVPTWHAVEAHLGRGGTEPPFWAWAWPGSIALARVLLDAPERVRGRRVLDFGAGCGLASIAALRVGAAYVRAVEIDALAATACGVNADACGVSPDVRLTDLLASGEIPDVDVVVAGDVCYDRHTAQRTVAWLRRCAAAGLDVLIADPGRTFAPVDGVAVVAAFEVPVPHDLESVGVRHATVCRVSA